MSTEGVKLSGASRAGATVNGSTLWRHPDRKSRGPKVQHVHFLCTGISQASGQRRYLNCTHKISFYMKFSDYVSSYPIYFIWDIFLSVHPVSGHHPIFIARYFSVILHALDVYIERKIED